MTIITKTTWVVTTIVTMCAQYVPCSAMYEQYGLQYAARWEREDINTAPHHAPEKTQKWETGTAVVYRAEDGQCYDAKIQEPINDSSQLASSDETESTNLVYIKFDINGATGWYDGSLCTKKGAAPEAIDLVAQDGIASLKSAITVRKDNQYPIRKNLGGVHQRVPTYGRARGNVGRGGQNYSTPRTQQRLAELDMQINYAQTGGAKPSPATPNGANIFWKKGARVKHKRSNILGKVVEVFEDAEGKNVTVQWDGSNRYCHIRYAFSDLERCSW